MRQETNSKGLAVTFDTSVPAGAVFTGDSERLRQVVFNLLGNAVKFTSEGIVGLKIEPRENNGVSGISIHVYDTGVGMNPEQQKLVFEEFTQANNEIRRKYGGTGLGLSICRKLVRAMQGNLSLESEVDKGSTFSLWIPGLQNPEETKSDSPHPSVGLYDTRCPTAVQTLANGIKAAGRNVVTYSDAEQMKDLVGREKTQTIVVARQTEGEDINAWLLEFLKQDVSRRLIAVGGSRRLMREFSPDQVIDVPDFPTSDELDAALAAKKRQKKPFRKHSSQEDAQILQVLIVEDNLINQKVMTKFLTRFPCEVMVANNGQEAVDLVSRINNLDLIFMDCQMPIMDGMEATKIIRANGNHIPILALTANASTSDRDECLEAGMDGFLTKPVSMESIAKVFERVLTGEGDF
jgi:CheY-like chemotaxis protein/anti-sigma regulatory factor (Ser/Thr protein kinase)